MCFSDKTTISPQYDPRGNLEKHQSKPQPVTFVDPKIGKVRWWDGVMAGQCCDWWSQGECGRVEAGSGGIHQYLQLELVRDNVNQRCRRVFAL